MASFTLPRSLLLLPLLSLFSTISISEAKPSFTFGKNASFGSDDIALFGEANLLNDGSSVSIQLNDSVSHNSGRVVYKKPINFAETKTEYPAGFSTFIAFSVSPSGGRLGFVVFPVNGTFDQSLFEVKFDTLDSFTTLGDSNVKVSVDGTSRNFTVANLEKEEILYAWINYIAGGKFLEVRLSRSESFEHVDPVMFTRIDLSEMLKGEDEFMVGVKSYGGSFSLRSWSLEARSVPKGEHSYGAIMVEQLIEEEEAKRKRKARVWEIVTCFVSTGLVFFAMMHIWAAFKRSKLVMAMHEECGIKTKEFEYEKMEKMEAVMMSKADAQNDKK